MSEQEPERIDDDVQPDPTVEGTSTGDPIAGVTLSEEEAEDAVVPDEDVVEVDGPTQKHA